jgi:hypothetical protein
MNLPDWLTPRRLVFLGALVIVSGLVYRRCAPPRYGSPEAAIAALLDEGTAAAREGRVGDMIELVSASYQGGADGGPADRAELRAYLTMGLARGGAEVRSLSRDIEVHGSTATVRTSLVVIAGGLGGIADGRAGARDLELGLALEGDVWKVVSSRSEALIAP